MINIRVPMSDIPISLKMGGTNVVLDDKLVVDCQKATGFNTRLALDQRFRDFSEISSTILDFKTRSLQDDSNII